MNTPTPPCGTRGLGPQLTRRIMSRLGRHFARGLGPLLGLWLLLGDARAEDGKLEVLRRNAKQAPADADASLALGRALRRAGRNADALVELRRGQKLATARTGERAIRLRYELARVFLDDRKFREALSACANVGAVPGGEALGHACTAAAHMTRKRATEALPEAQLALGILPLCTKRRSWSPRPSSWTAPP